MSDFVNTFFNEILESFKCYSSSNERIAIQDLYNFYKEILQNFKKLVLIIKKDELEDFFSTENSYKILFSIIDDYLQKISGMKRFY